MRQSVQAPGPGPTAHAVATAVLACALLLPMPAAAQARADAAAADAAQVQPLGPPARIGFRAFGHYEMVSFAAKETFDAVFGRSTMEGPGGGGEVTGLWKGLFVRGAMSQMSDTGTRAFVFGNDVIPLNIPHTVKIRTMELGGGWRVQPRRMPRLAVYGGGGMLFVNYDQTSDFAEAGENASESFNGAVVFGGAEFTIWKWIFAGAEAQYRSVPDALGGEGSISELYNEQDLGGTTLRVLFGIRR